MPLRALLSDVHPAWYATSEALDPQLAARARASLLGQRMLVRALPQSATDALLAPRPGGNGHVATVARWPRERLFALVRDLGVLAYAPMIRAEVRREPVRWLRKVLGNSYLLALDRGVWDGQVARDMHARLAAGWEASLRDPRFLEDPALLGALLDLQGRAELQAWAGQRSRALADWARLVLGDAQLPPSHLPEKAVLRVTTHHETRGAD